MDNSESLKFFLSDIWPLVLEECRKNIATEAAFKLWIVPMVPQDFSNGSVVLATQEFHKKIVEEKYMPVLNNAFLAVLGFTVNIIIVTAEAPAAQAEETETETEKEPNTFDSFIVGSSNRLAYAAASAVAKNPGGVHNPLFIYGRSGLGKTHLLKAIECEVLKNNPSARILYTNSENFTNELILHVMEKRMTDFHNKYRNTDIMLMDDVQFIAGKVQTQEEFFHTFDSLISEGKQVVLTSDKPPKDIQTLEDRLRSRFEQGLLADIQPPDLETRMAIIKKRAAAKGLQIPDAVVEFICDKLKNNIRQLEGAVQKMHALWLLDKSVPPIVLANEAIKDVLTYNRPVSATINSAIEQVGKTFGVSPEEIRSDKKRAPVSNARQISMYVIREITDLSLETIGKEFNGKNHSTVLYSIESVEKKMENNPPLKATIYEIIKNIQDS